MWIGGWAVRETKMHCVKFCPASSTERQPTYAVQVHWSADAAAAEKMRRKLDKRQKKLLPGLNSLTIAHKSENMQSESPKTIPFCLFVFRANRKLPAVFLTIHSLHQAIRHRLVTHEQNASQREIKQQTFLQLNRLLQYFYQTMNLSSACQRISNSTSLQIDMPITSAQLWNRPKEAINARFVQFFFLTFRHRMPESMSFISRTPEPQNEILIFIAHYFSDFIKNLVQHNTHKYFSRSVSICRNRVSNLGVSCALSTLSQKIIGWTKSERARKP